MATTKQQILDYVMNSPYNSNRLVLDGLLNAFKGSDTANLDAFIAGNLASVTSQLTEIPDFAFSAKKCFNSRQYS